MATKECIKNTIYVLTIGIVNVLLAYTVCQMYMWA